MKTFVASALLLAASSVPVAVGRDCYLRDIDYRSYGPDSGYTGVNTGNLKECTQLLLSNWPNSANPNSQDQPLEAAGAVDLLRHFDDSLQVTWLNLDYNNIGDVGAAVLSSALEKTPTLTSLHLLKNGISDSGAMALATQLEENENVLELNLRYNEIGDKGAIALADLILKNRVIQHLYLSSNNIGEKGMAAIASTLGTNVVIKTLDLEDNPATGGPSYERIQQLLEHDGTVERNENL